MRKSLNLKLSLLKKKKKRFTEVSDNMLGRSCEKNFPQTISISQLNLFAVQLSPKINLSKLWFLWHFWLANNVPILIGNPFGRHWDPPWPLSCCLQQPYNRSCFFQTCCPSTTNPYQPTNRCVNICHNSCTRTTLSALVSSWNRETERNFLQIHLTVS